MFKEIIERLKIKRRQNLENLYELVYEVEVNKNNLIAEQDKKISELKFQAIELEEKVNYYKQKIKEMRDNDGK